MDQDALTVSIRTRQHMPCAAAFLLRYVLQATAQGFQFGVCMVRVTARLVGRTYAAVPVPDPSSHSIC